MINSSFNILRSWLHDNICIARIFTSIGEIVFELTLCFLGQHVLCLFTNITMKKNSYYREALRINIMCVVTNFKKAA